MNELTDQEIAEVRGGSVSTDTTYGAAIGVSLFALGALVTIATAGVAAPMIVTIGLGVLGTGANIAAITVAR